MLEISEAGEERREKKRVEERREKWELYMRERRRVKWARRERHSEREREAESAVEQQLPTCQVLIARTGTQYSTVQYCTVCTVCTVYGNLSHAAREY